MNVSHNTLASIRVFVPTYRRQALLPRALASLRAQTFNDWICEVHNDDPADSFPAELVKQLADPRIELRQHERNLGAIATFNLFYHPTREPFFALLEDDNWWEPEFLRTMMRELSKHPDITLAWCNQKVWEELPDGSWRDTKQFANNIEKSGPRLVKFGKGKQLMGALHANGAMVMRSRVCETYVTPFNIPFFAIEAFRDRMIPHPLLYVPEPLAIFARTIHTSRSESRAETAIVQSMLAATFIKHAQYSDARLAEMFAEARAKRPPHTGPLILAALFEPSCRKLLYHSKARDWLLLLRGFIRRPSVFWYVLGSRRRHTEWWQFLDRHTAARFKELRSSNSCL
jgi:glycosyltransferase involved in cell wall biosynthesis